MKTFFIKMAILLLILGISLCNAQENNELVYGETEFPISFIKHLRKFKFNPLKKFQTEVEGRLIELTCDPLIDIYEVYRGRYGYRHCLATYIIQPLVNKKVLFINLKDIKWLDGTPLIFDDIWFTLEYKKRNKNTWNINPNLIIAKETVKSFYLYFGDNPEKAPSPGELYFPIVNKNAFIKADNPEEAIVNKNKQKIIGYGRYYIKKVVENKYILLKRNKNHPYFKNLKIPPEYNRIEKIRMQAFPRSRLNRNEQFIEGRIHLITSVNELEKGYILNSFTKARICEYTDNSFTGFLFNCRHPYLKVSCVRRAFNYFFRREKALEKLGIKGEKIGLPLPKRNFFYNSYVPLYHYNIEKGLALLKLYVKWGLDVYEENGNIIVFKNIKGPAQELKKGDQILELENKKVKNIEDILKILEKFRRDKNNKIIRVKIKRGIRILTKRIKKGIRPNIGILETIYFKNNKIKRFPILTLIANNPEGKNLMVKSVCGELKETLKKVGIEVKIDNLKGKDYYKRLLNGEFDLAYRTLKIIGTPNIYRMFYYNKNEKNINYGGYYNLKINDIAKKVKNITNIEILKKAWYKAGEIMNIDPPYIYLWSKKNIILYSPRIKIIKPNPEYEIPYGYIGMSGFINIFNEIHLWALKD